MKCTGSFVSFILPAPPNIVKIVFQNFVFFPLHFSLRLQEELPFRKKSQVQLTVLSFILIAAIIFYECGGVKTSELDLSRKKIAVFIGSEGGFEREEVDYALSRGFTAASLGERILRCETAPIAALSVLMNLTGNL